MKLKLICAAIISTISISSVYANLYVSRNANGNMIFTNVRDGRLNQKQVTADSPNPKEKHHIAKGKQHSLQKQINEAYDLNQFSAADAMTCGDFQLANELEIETIRFLAPYESKVQLISEQERFRKGAEFLYSTQKRAKLPANLCPSMLKQARDHLQLTKDKKWLKF